MKIANEKNNHLFSAVLMNRVRIWVVSRSSYFSRRLCYVWLVLSCEVKAIHKLLIFRKLGFNYEKLLSFPVVSQSDEYCPKNDFIEKLCNCQSVWQIHNLNVPIWQLHNLNVTVWQVVVNSLSNHWKAYKYFHTAIN